MKLRLIVAALGLALAGPALAHGGHVRIQDFPFSLGINLGHHHQPARHVHGAHCRHDAGPRRWHRQHHRQGHRAYQGNDHRGHRNRQARSHHSHGRQCYLQYPRGHRHWH